MLANSGRKRFFFLRSFVWMLLILCLELASSCASSTSQTYGGLGHPERHRSFRAGLFSSNFTNYVDSPNWSGYFVGSGSGNGFKGVEGNWNTQCYSGYTSSSRDVASWVGLGGWGPFHEALVQTGTLLVASGHYVFFEAVVNADGSIANFNYFGNIGCGKHMQAYVLYHSSRCPQGFTTEVLDNSDNTGYVFDCLNFTGGHQSAEWIDERLDCGSGYNYKSLVDFHYTQWSNVQAEANYNGAPWANPNAYVNTQLAMYDAGPNGQGGSHQYLAYPDGASVNSNNTFTDRWYDYGNSYSSCSP